MWTLSIAGVASLRIPCCNNGFDKSRSRDLTDQTPFYSVGGWYIPHYLQSIGGNGFLEDELLLSKIAIFHWSMMAERALGISFLMRTPAVPSQHPLRPSHCLWWWFIKLVTPQPQCPRSNKLEWEKWKGAKLKSELGCKTFSIFFYCKRYKSARFAGPPHTLRSLKGGCLLRIASHASHSDRDWNCYALLEVMQWGGEWWWLWSLSVFWGTLFGGLGC